MAWFFGVSFLVLLGFWALVLIWAGCVALSSKKLQTKYDQCYVQITKGPSAGNYGRIAQTPLTPFGYFKIVVTYNKTHQYAVLLKKDSFVSQKAAIVSIQSLKKDVI